MAKFNMQFAAEMLVHYPVQAAKLGVSVTELNDLLAAAAAVRLPYNEEKRIHEQDDEAFMKPVWPFETTPKDHYPLLLHYHPLTIYRYQVNKQADTLLADYLFPDDLDQAQLKREYDYYEKITTHDSSLSRSVFSALATRIEQPEKAYQYFMDTAKMNLIDLQGNAADGLHVANLDGSWLSIVTGFGGVRLKNQQLVIDNHLPAAWQSLTIRIQFQQRLLEIVYQHQHTEVSLLTGEPLTINVDGAMTQVG